MSATRTAAPFVMVPTSESWIDEVPSEWDMRRLKTLFRERSVKGYPDLPLLAATQKQGVVTKETYGLRTVIAQSGLENLKLVEPGDFVISLRSFEGGIEVSHARGIISPAYTVLRIHDQSLHGYFVRLFKSRDFLDAIRLSVTGIREGQNVDYSRLGRSLVIVPTPESCVAIVRYLDHADLRIAKAIAAKQQVLKLLRERQKQVAQAVVLGVPVGAQTVESGESWLGKVPEHWELRRMKSWFIERSVKNHPHLPLLAATQSRGVVTKEEYGLRTVIAQTGLENLKVVEPGDFVISLRSFEGGIEVSYAEGIISPAYTVLRPKDSSTTAYLTYLLKTPAFIDALRMSVTGIREGQNINYARLSRCLVPMPPPEERVAMVAKLREVLSGGELAIKAINDEIALLKEFRTRLISDVVTGKLDVRDEANKLPEIDPMELATVAVSENGDDEEATDDD